MRIMLRKRKKTEMEKKGRRGLATDRQTGRRVSPGAVRVQ